MTPTQPTPNTALVTLLCMNMWGSRAVVSRRLTEGVPKAVKNGHAIAGTYDRWRWLDASIDLVVGRLDCCQRTSADEEAEATFLAMMNGIRPENAGRSGPARRLFG